MIILAVGARDAHGSLMRSSTKRSGLSKYSTFFFDAKKDNTSSQALVRRSGLQCGVTSQTNSGSDKYELCPAECPYFAQNREDTKHCTFLCVEADQCAKWNPNKPMADFLKGTRTCRGPRVNFCTEMNMDGTDSCKVCQAGFEVHADDGGCYFAWWNTLWTITCIILAIVLILVVWIVDMCCRETVNGETLQETIVWRSRSKILAPKDVNGKRRVYAWNTNLCTEDVAGVGMLLHFRFQVFVIGWALVIAILWTVLACFHNELFVLGTRRFGTPRQNCILVAWGYETQQRLMWTKVLFLAIAYVFTFLSTMVFAVYQERCYQKLDSENKTYRDFALELTGLPPLPANDPQVEDLIKQAVQTQTGLEIIGVSVAWNFTEVREEVMQLASARDVITRTKQTTRANEKVVRVEGAEGLRVGQRILVGVGRKMEEHEIAEITRRLDDAPQSPRAAWSIVLKAPLKNSMESGTAVCLKEFLRVSGAGGDNAHHINGDYEKKADFNGRAAWQKMDEPSTWALVFKDRKWYITSQKCKDSGNPSGSYLCQKEEDEPDESLYSPTNVEAWSSLEGEDIKGLVVEYYKGSYPKCDGFSAMHQKMYDLELCVLGPDPLKEIDPQKLLANMESSSTAYAIFKNEQDRELAYSLNRGIMFNPSKIEKLPDQDGKIEMFPDKDLVLSVQRVACEPAAINWNYFGDDSPSAMFNRFVWNLCTWYLGALSVWFFVFYVPYAVSLYNFNYDNGAELPSYYGLIFTMVVVGGNATMYVICDLVAENVQFRYKDTKQVVYVLMYLFACTVNVLLDMVVTWYTAKKVMIGQDFRTYDGRRLADVESFTEQFETYAMQRSLAENTYAYAFPSTFLVPFVLEPFVTIIVPLQLGRLVVRTHREITGACAEAYLMAFEFDLGRYADILLNVFLGILIFYFPGGYTWSLFYGMFISHIVIYVFDHWRVLNVIPNVKIVSNEVDWWSQLMFIPCCSLILSCLVFKMNCESYAGYCAKDMELIYSTTLAGIAHFIVHLLLFVYMVPAMAGKVETKVLDQPFEEIAEQDAHGWFSVNPVHCLRSQYILQDAPYSRFCTWGKEHFLKKNPSIGVYFEDEPASTEESFAAEVADFEQMLRRRTSHSIKKLEEEYLEYRAHLK
mmetsp:Transcript_122802/g.194552  ORF Transcript_122802/g.194552 Transcript_122802/m.194552 type:complete len:1134 (+) Transcript_122802:3-3404(+)